MSKTPTEGGPCHTPYVSPLSPPDALREKLRGLKTDAPANLFLKFLSEGQSGLCLPNSPSFFFFPPRFFSDPHFQGSFRLWVFFVTKQIGDVILPFFPTHAVQTSPHPSPLFLFLGVGVLGFLGGRFMALPVIVFRPFQGLSASAQFFFFPFPIPTQTFGPLASYY